MHSSDHHLPHFSGSSGSALLAPSPRSRFLSALGFGRPEGPAEGDAPASPEPRDEDADGEEPAGQDSKAAPVEEPLPGAEGQEQASRAAGGAAGGDEDPPAEKAPALVPSPEEAPGGDSSVDSPAVIVSLAGDLAAELEDELSSDLGGAWERMRGASGLGEIKMPGWKGIAGRSGASFLQVPAEPSHKEAETGDPGADGCDESGMALLAETGPGFPRGGEGLKLEDWENDLVVEVVSPRGGDEEPSSVEVASLGESEAAPETAEILPETVVASEGAAPGMRPFPWMTAGTGLALTSGEGGSAGAAPAPAEPLAFSAGLAALAGLAGPVNQPGISQAWPWGGASSSLARLPGSGPGLESLAAKLDRDHHPDPVPAKIPNPAEPAAESLVPGAERNDEGPGFPVPCDGEVGGRGGEASGPENGDSEDAGESSPWAAGTPQPLSAKDADGIAESLGAAGESAPADAAPVQAEGAAAPSRSVSLPVFPAFGASGAPSPWKPGAAWPAEAARQAKKPRPPVNLTRQGRESVPQTVLTTPVVPQPTRGDNPGEENAAETRPPVARIVREPETRGPVPGPAEPPASQTVPAAEEMSQLSPEILDVACPSCGKGLSIRREHLGVAGQCVWCQVPLVAARSGVDGAVRVFLLQTLSSPVAASAAAPEPGAGPPQMPAPSPAPEAPPASPSAEVPALSPSAEAPFPWKVPAPAATEASGPSPLEARAAALERVLFPGLPAPSGDEAVPGASAPKAAVPAASEEGGFSWMPPKLAGDGPAAASPTPDAASPAPPEESDAAMGGPADFAGLGSPPPAKPSPFGGTDFISESTLPAAQGFGSALLSPEALAGEKPNFAVAPGSGDKGPEDAVPQALSQFLSAAPAAAGAADPTVGEGAAETINASPPAGLWSAPAGAPGAENPPAGADSPAPPAEAQEPPALPSPQKKGKKQPKPPKVSARQRIAPERPAMFPKVAVWLLVGAGLLGGAGIAAIFREDIRAAITPWIQKIAPAPSGATPAPAAEEGDAGSAASATVPALPGAAKAAGVVIEPARPAFDSLPLRIQDPSAQGPDRLSDEPSDQLE